MNRYSTMLPLFAALAVAACSRKAELNYKHCLKLRVGMTKAEMVKVMGEPEETIPYVEGKSLAHLKGRTAFEWSNPASMPGGDHVSLDEASGKIESIRCSNSEITASVYVEPPAPSTATAVALSTRPAALPLAVSVSTAPVDLAAALSAYGRKDLSRAFAIARPLADADNADAQLLLGLLYSDEKVNDASNDAAKWFYRAGRKKNGEAAFAYAASLERGGTSPNKIVEEFTIAADLQSPAAELREALMMIDGYGEVVAKDIPAGEKLLLHAAQSGSPQAQMALAERSRTVTKDLVEAYRWTWAASKHAIVSKYDDPLHAFSNTWSAEERASALDELNALAKKMTPAQIAQAKKL